MTQAEFEKLPREQRPPKRNLTLEQFIEEQSRKANPFDYEGTAAVFCDDFGGEGRPRRSWAWRVPRDLDRRYVHEAGERGLLEEL